MNTAPAPLRLALVNDYEIVVRGLAAMLAGYRDRVEVVELDNRLPVESQVDVVMMDAFGYISGDGIDVADLVRQDGPKVVVFAISTEPGAVREALDSGAAGYLSKSLTAAELVEALEAVAGGQRVVPEGLQPEDGAAAAGLDWPGHDVGLSPREAEMMALIAKGLSNQEIAQTVFLSVNSVKTYVRTAYRKIGVTRRSQATRWALEHGFGVDTKRTSPGR